MPETPRSKGGPAWSLTVAKARFSAVFQLAFEGTPQRIVRNGHESVVVVRSDLYEQQIKPPDTLLEFFAKSPHPDVELDIERNRETWREVDA